MRNVPGHLMSAEPFTLTEAQIDALNALPPGVYLVCYQCRRFNPLGTSFQLVDGGAICDSCHKWGGPMPKKVDFSAVDHAE